MGKLGGVGEENEFRTGKGLSIPVGGKSDLSESKPPPEVDTLFGDRVVTPSEGGRGVETGRSVVGGKANPADD